LPAPGEEAPIKHTAILALLALAPMPACQEHHHPASGIHAAPSSSSSATNPVQQEMRLLSSALQEAVVGVGMGDVRGVEHALHRVHSAKQATAAALSSGSYRPPKNPTRMDRFAALDERFHGTLERLAESSRRNDVAGTADALGVALKSCQECHGEFRR
jgi:cytochrome c556